MPAKPSGTAAHRLCPPPCVCRQAPPWCRRGWWRVGRRGKESRRTKASGALLHWASSMLYFSLKMNENLLSLRSTHGHEVDAAASKSHKCRPRHAAWSVNFLLMCVGRAELIICAAPQAVGPAGAPHRGYEGLPRQQSPLSLAWHHLRVLRIYFQVSYRPGRNVRAQLPRTQYQGYQRISQGVRHSCHNSLFVDELPHRVLWRYVHRDKLYLTVSRQAGGSKRNMATNYCDNGCFPGARRLPPSLQVRTPARAPHPPDWGNVHDTRQDTDLSGTFPRITAHRDGVSTKFIHLSFWSPSSLDSPLSCTTNMCESLTSETSRTIPP